MVRSSISSVYSPTWIERPPSNLSSASHGKLRADVWFSLFTVFLPLILVVRWGNVKSYRFYWENFAALFSITNIACSYSTSAAAANLAEKCYNTYQQGE
ncbi:hypothetical protein BT69DRAFT_1234047 [Atractiella rhizophila]|nr:hypothetical protein BT69DRAFT_1234047 [Atractiella rhizophila]